MNAGNSNRMIRWSTCWGEPLLLFLLALLVRLAYSQPNAHWDEFYHMLAAESLLDHGTLAIADGTYTRAWLFTYAVAASYWLFGRSMEAARYPSVLSGALLVMSVFLWTRSRISRGAAWAASLLLCFSALAIHFSLMARFYMPQALLIWWVAVIAYRLLDTPLGRARRAGLIVLASGLSLVVLHLQISSLIPLGVIGSWWLIETGQKHYRNATSAGPRVVVLAGAAALVLLGILAFYSGAITRALLLFRSVVGPWAKPNQNNWLYYHGMFLRWQPTLWVLFPILVLVALRTCFKPVAYCVGLFGAAFVVHSIAGMKHPRYLFYALPFFFVPCGVVLSRLVPYLRGELETWVRYCGIRLDTSRWRSNAIATVALGLSVFPLYFSAGYHETPRLLVGSAASPMHNADWASATALLRGTLDTYDVVISSASVKALYHLRRSDFGISATELRSAPEFTIDPRVGRPLITRVDSLRKIQAGAPRGLIVIEASHWKNPAFVPVPLSEYIEKRLQRVPLPESTGVMAFRWGGPDKSSPPGR